MFLKKKEDGVWQSISDLMTGLMIIFLFICLGFLYDVKQTQAELEATKQAYDVTRVSIYNSLNEEFKPEELAKWGTHINPDNLKVSFSEPSVYFAEGSPAVNDYFQNVLNEFFPRYIKVLQRYTDEIVEVRIEGNASKDWGGMDPNSPGAYFNNMGLSQQRAYNVLQYVYSLSDVEDMRPWLRDKMRANGASYSNAVEDESASRCVTISVHRNAESILEGLSNGK